MRGGTLVIFGHVVKGHILYSVYKEFVSNEIIQNS